MLSEFYGTREFLSIARHFLGVKDTVAMRCPGCLAAHAHTPYSR